MAKAKMIHRKDFNSVVSALYNHPAYKPHDTAYLPEVLASLAHYGALLQNRYGNTCSYEWATTPAYERRTETIERNARELAASVGLEIYLQGDPRGATVYVSWEPIEDNNYTRSGSYCLSFRGKDY